MKKGGEKDFFFFLYHPFLSSLATFFFPPPFFLIITRFVISTLLSSALYSLTLLCVDIAVDNPPNHKTSRLSLLAIYNRNHWCSRKGPY